MARLCFTQQDGWQITVHHALLAVEAIDESDTGARARKRRQRARRELLQDRERLEALGVTFIDDDTIRFRRPPGVLVSLPEHK